MTRYAMAIDYDYCTGCHTCEVSCKMEHGLPTGQWGIKLTEIGPWEYGDGQWQYKWVPVPTDQCDRCPERLAVGKKPMCVANCYTACMKFGTLEEVLQEIADEEEKFGRQSNHVIYQLKDLAEE